jgi:hypothetical protein
MAAFVGTHEGPVVPAHRDGPQPALGGVVGHAQAAIVEEARERGPTIEAVLMFIDVVCWACDDPGSGAMLLPDDAEARVYRRT